MKKTKAYKTDPGYSVLRPIYTVMKLLFLYAYDFYIFLVKSGLVAKYRESLEAKVAELTHSIERGLSLRQSRQNFGKEKINKLFELMPHIAAADYRCLWAASALAKYFECNPDSDSIEKITNYPCGDMGGTLRVSKSDILATTGLPFDIFSQNRFSVRDFTNREVDLKLLKRAVKIAQKSPSACNRQPVRIYIVTDRLRVKDLLDLQGGANGFKEYANKLLIIAVDTRVYLYASERNLGQLDCGMFGMSLLYALHFLGIGACPLMWINSPKRDREIKKMCKIDSCHRVIFLIAVGHLPEIFKVAKSPRLPADTIYYIR